jgi:2'-5' RNA ligase
MENNLTTIPGYRVNDYLLVLQPHADLEHRILSLREEFGEKYKLSRVNRGKPQLALLRFSQLELMEERILNNFRNISLAMPPFKVELKDFGSFPSHSIHINVASKMALQLLSRELRTAQKLLKLDNEHKPHFIEEFHFTLANKLLPWQYEKGWLEYSHRNFTGRFIADAMILLGKKQGMGSFHFLEKLQFQNLPVKTKQGDLF